MSKDELLSMTPASAQVLAKDLEDWGSVAVGMTRDQVQSEIGLPHKRSRRLWAWVRKYGSADPRERVRPFAMRPLQEGSGGRKHLIIPDAHTQPGQALQRFEWLGRMIQAHNPDVVVCLGDWGSYDSLCAQRTLSERVEDRTMEEVEQARMALVALESKLGRWGGRKVFCMGNHDVRVERISDDAPWMAGTLVGGEAHKKYGWEVQPFCQPISIDGVSYVHYLTKKGSNKPLSGKFHATRMLERVKYGESVVCGHSHLWQHQSEAHRFKRKHALVAGCYIDHMEDYAGEMDNGEWWSGITILNNVVDGDFDIETWSIDRIRATYGT